MTIELKGEERKVPSCTVEISPETYAELDKAIKGIVLVAGGIRGMIPAHLQERLDACAAKAQGAMGMMDIVKAEPEEEAHEFSPTCDCPNCRQERRNQEADRRYDEARDKEMDERRRA